MRFASSRLIRRIALLPVALILLTCAVDASAEPTAKKPARRAIPARTASAAPDKTGSIAEPKAPAPAAPAKDAATHVELVPFYLPDVPRARMRACGETWREKKMSGEVGDEAWREFAIKCLTADGSTASR